MPDARRQRPCRQRSGHAPVARASLPLIPMPHPLVAQLRFTRSEFKRALAGVSDEDARRRLLPMNSIGWNIGHLAWQEQRSWLIRAQGRMLLPDVNERFANGAPACTPS